MSLRDASDAPLEVRDPHEGDEFDESQVLWLLSLSPLERLEHHEHWRQFVLNYRGAAAQSDAISPGLSSTPP